MLHERIPNLRAAVEPDRVHRSVYTDPDIFEQEMLKMFETAWIYCGHESQVKNAGDYWTVQIGRQPMVMVRAKDRRIHVLYDRCPHRGVKICGSRHGNAGDAFTCSYHSWRFHHDGSLESIPLAKGYEGTRLTAGGKCSDNPDCSMARAPRVEAYRGFVFASLAKDGPTLSEFLGDAKAAFDDMCDRAPEGEVEVVPNCFRVIQHSNWKFFMENQLDALHPSVTHESTGRAAQEIEFKIKRATGATPLHYHYLSAFTIPFEKWDQVQTRNLPHGHCVLEGYMGLRPQDPDTLEYERVLTRSYGEARKEEILSTNIHHVLVYPCLSIQSPLQQLRAIRPLGPDKTLSEIWHFRLKGAPEPIYRRSLWYYNLVNSPATLVNADDLENWTKGQIGLGSKGLDWVSFHRNHGQDIETDGVVRSRNGTSEAPMRNQFKAWIQYMTAE